MRVYLSPYSAVVTGALDLMTEYMPPTGWGQIADSSKVVVSHTSVGDFCGYLEQIVVPDVSVSFRHGVWVAAFATELLMV
jgi:hypothetical protein